MRLRDRGLIAMLLWRPVLVLAAVGLMFSRYRERAPWIIVVAAVFYVAWLIAERRLRRR
jgi:hypothetical protein